MKTNVKYKELSDISYFINTKKDEIDLIFQEITQVIESVDKAWSGKDCKEFIEEAKNKIEIEKKNNRSLKTFADNLKKVADDYASFDDKWAEEAKRES